MFEALSGLWRRLLAWELLPTPGPEGAKRDGAVERPWRYYWDHLPKRTAGADFTTRDYQEARQRAEEVARTTLGDDLWARLALDGHLDVKSRRYPGHSYRLRMGRRIEVGLTDHQVDDRFALAAQFVRAVRGRGAGRRFDAPDPGGDARWAHECPCLLL